MAVRQAHGVGEETDDRLVHAHAHLLGTAGQAQLGAHDALSLGKTLCPVLILYLITPPLVQSGVGVGERSARHAGEARRAKFLGGSPGGDHERLPDLSRRLGRARRSRNQSATVRSATAVMPWPTGSRRVVVAAPDSSSR